MATIKFQDVKRIYNALCLDKDALTLFKDCSGRTWLIANRHLYGGKDYYSDGTLKVPVTDYGLIGSYELVDGRYFEYYRKNSTNWNIRAGGIDLVFEILPPFDCTDCKHLIYIDEEESGYEDGGFACRFRWDAGDTYLCWNTQEAEGSICQKFQPDNNMVRYKPEKMKYYRPDTRIKCERCKIIQNEFTPKFHNFPHTDRYICPDCIEELKEKYEELKAQGWIQ